MVDALRITLPIYPDPMGELSVNDIKFGMKYFTIFIESTKPKYNDGAIFFDFLSNDNIGDMYASRLYEYFGWYIQTLSIGRLLINLNLDVIEINNDFVILFGSEDAVDESMYHEQVVYRQLCQVLR